MRPQFAPSLKILLVATLLPLAARLAVAQPAQAGQQGAHGSSIPGDSVTLRIVNTDLRSAVQLMAQYIDRPVVFAGQGSVQVTFETPRPVPRSDVVRMLRGLVESQNHELVDDSLGGIYRVRAREAQRPQFAGLAPPRQAASGGPIELFVIPLRHARAGDVASTIGALYGKGGAAGAGGGDAGRPPSLDDELRQLRVPEGATAAPAAAVSTGGRAAVLTGELTIVADPRANSLLIRANRNDFQLIEAAVKQLDVRPLQALIEVLIAEVQRDRSFSVGTDLEVGDRPLGRDKTIGGTMSGAGEAGLGDFALKVMGVGGVDVNASIRVAVGRGDVQVLSRPVVLTANNEEARIVVGSQRPFVQVSRALPTDAAVRDQIVQYKDVGTKLTVRPTISIDGLVQLEVTQEISNATTETAFNAPVIATRSVSTQLLVRDGQTVVLGGLTDRQKDVASRGVPFLSSIPVLGGLFGRHARRSTATELFIFLTPRVIRTDDDAARLTQPLHDRAESVKP